MLLRSAALAATLLTACSDGPPLAPLDAAPRDAPARPDAAAPDATALPDAARTADASLSDAATPLPNLVLLPEATTLSLDIDDTTFAEDSCSLLEMCIGAPGRRRLLRFDVVTANLGEADLALGAPSEGPLWQYSTCHMHFHFRDYAFYELVSADGVVATGHKQAFCLMDTDQVDPDSNPASPFNCENQGIHRGWSDRYSAHLPCQWIDITDVVPGNYLLRVRINYDHVLPESNYADNLLELPVTIP